MKKILLLIACVACLIMCACTPQKTESPDDPNQTPPATAEPTKGTPGMTIVSPSETPVEIIDPADPSDSPVVIPLDTSAPSGEDTPEPSPSDTSGSTVEPTPDSTPAPSPDASPVATENGIELPYVPVGPK